VLGALGGFVCFFAVNWVKGRLRIDDSLDVFAVHGIGGMLGSLLVAVFALPLLGGAGFGHEMSAGGQFAAQFVGVAAAAIWSIVCTVAIVKILGATVGTRVSVEEQREGLDLSTHGERAYDLA
jgi:Amt family ammonium transporter